VTGPEQEKGPAREPGATEPRDAEPTTAAPDGEADEGPDLLADGSMSLLDHLEELRGTLISVLAAFALSTIICWFFSRPLLDFLVRPILSAAEGVYFHSPIEAFTTRLKLSAVCGIFLVLPYIFYKIYGFILPGLYQKERKLVTPLLVSSTALFYLGVAFAFLVVIPKVVAFMLSFGTDVMQPLIGIGPYFSFVARLCLAFGLMFELPLVVLFLSLLGLINPRWLLRGWRYALIIIATVSAILTPPDVFSQLVMAVPVMLLYIVSVLVAIVVTRRRRQAAERDED
jgi:sec-independent protein translocase protein TatC